MRIKQTRCLTHGICNLRKGEQTSIKINNPTNRQSKKFKWVSACILKIHAVNIDTTM